MDDDWGYSYFRKPPNELSKDPISPRAVEGNKLFYESVPPRTEEFSHQNSYGCLKLFERICDDHKGFWTQTCDVWP